MTGSGTGCTFSGVALQDHEESHGGSCSQARVKFPGEMRLGSCASFPGCGTGPETVTADGGGNEGGPLSLQDPFSHRGS